MYDYKGVKWCKLFIIPEFQVNKQQVKKNWPNTNQPQHLVLIWYGIIQKTPMQLYSHCLPCLPGLTLRTATGANGYCHRSMRPSVCPKRRCCSYLFKDFSIGLKFSGMMHSTMKQIAVQNGHAQSIFACFMELWNFPWYAWTRSEGQHYCTLRISAISLRFGGMMHSTMKQIAI